MSLTENMQRVLCAMSRGETSPSDRDAARSWFAASDALMRRGLVELATVTSWSRLDRKGRRVWQTHSARRLTNEGRALAASFCTAVAS